MASLQRFVPIVVSLVLLGCASSNPVGQIPNYHADVYPLSEFDGTMKVRDWSKVPDFPAPPPTPSGGEAPKVHPKTFFDDLLALFQDAPPLPDAARTTIQTWIAEGAPNN